MSDTELLLELLAESDWRVVRRRQREELLPDHVSRRYPRLPLDVRSFLEDLEACFNKNETVWFLTRDDYWGNRVGMFRWNEHECMSLDAAGADDDERQRIHAYWDCHFPVMFAVHSDYDYLAVDVTPEACGQVVHGYLPEPEQASPVADSFAEFIFLFMQSLRGNARYPLSLFT